MKEYIYDKDCFINSKNSEWFYVDKDGNKITGIIFANLDAPERGNFDLVSFVENGKIHNSNGPALIKKHGELEYIVNDKYLGTNLSKEQFQQKIKEIIFT